MCPDGASTSPEGLFRQAVDGDQRALARLVSIAERGGPVADAVDALAASHTSRAHVVGVTGAPGVGKSTLLGRLATHAAEAGTRPAIVAVDPSSPITQGAILGDRLRMREMDPGLFVRSMAARGHPGGLAFAIPAVVRLLDAVGYDVVLLETLGVGQGDLDVTSVADTTVVVVAPRWGDSVQASKAGLLEMADVFVVNQADRAGASDAQHDLEAMLELGGGHERPWRVPVVSTDALADLGTADLWEAICAHVAFLDASGERTRRRAARARAEVRARALHALAGSVDRALHELDGETLATTLPAKIAHELLAALPEHDG